MRIYFLDNLKWGIIYLMVVFHAAMCYMAYAPEWWYVVDGAEPSFLATAFVCWADIFIMPVMFFVSGYFALASLSKHGSRGFWRRKVLRIGLPWLFGSLFIAPAVTYLMLASRNSPLGFLEFYQTMFWGPLYEQAQFWYLGALLALYGLLWLAVSLRPSFTERQEGRPPFLFWAALAVIISLSIGIISSGMHPDTWSFFAYILVLQPVRIPTYILVFFTGAWAWRSGWFVSGGYLPSPGLWVMPFLFCGGLYLYQKLFAAAWSLAPAALAWLNACCQGAFTVSALCFLLGFWGRCLNFTTTALSSLSATSYGVYYLHMEVLFPLVWALRETPLSPALKYILACALSLSICCLGSKYLLAKLPCFGGRQ